MKLKHLIIIEKNNKYNIEDKENILMNPIKENNYIMMQKILKNRLPCGLMVLLVKEHDLVEQVHGIALHQNIIRPFHAVKDPLLQIVAGAGIDVKIGHVRLQLGEDKAAHIVLRVEQKSRREHARRAKAVGMAERGKKRLQAAGGAAAKGNAVSVGSDGKVLLRIGLDGFHNETVKDLSLRCRKPLHLGGKHHLADAAGRQPVVAPRIVIVDAHDHRSPAGGGILGAHGFARVPAVPCGGLPVKEVLTVGHIDDRQPLAFLVSRHEHTHTAVVLAGIGQRKII